MNKRDQAVTGPAGLPAGSAAAGSSAKKSGDPRVHVTLAQLVAMRHRARGFSFLPRQPIHSLLAGRHASRLRGRGLNFEEIRRYQAGDDIRQIDWKVTARTRKTHSRVYTEERERSTLFLVDQRVSMFFGSQQKMKSVVAAETAALGAWRVLAQQDRAGALVFNDSDIVEIRPQRSQATVVRILEAIVRQNQVLTVRQPTPRRPDMLNEVLHRADRLATHDYLVCVITDGNGQDEQTRRLMTRIARHNDVLVGFVVDPLEGALPDAGPLVFGDGDTQLEVDTGQRGLRHRYQTEFEDDRAAGRAFLVSRSTPVIPLNTTGDVAEQIRRHLGLRRG